MQRDDLRDSAGSGGRRVRAVLNALDVLQHISVASHPLGVSELARRTSLNKATVFNILATLESRNLVSQDSTTRLYSLSWGLYELGSAVARENGLGSAVRGTLDALARASGETVLLGITDEDSVLYLDRTESPSGLGMVANAGRRSPYHATSSGKVLMAHLPQAHLTELLSGTFKAFTKRTITDGRELQSHLEEVRKQGFARCWQEHEVGVSSISIPLRDYTESVVAALTLAGPAQRLTARSLPRHLKCLREAANEIQARLGGSLKYRPT